MKTILVTGGLGYIGSHTIISLLENNFNVYIIDSLINSDEENLISIKKIWNLSEKFQKNRITFFKGDLKDKEFLKDTFQKAKIEGNPIEAVIHFAGLKSVNNSIKKPLDYWETNIYGSINLLSIMQLYKCKKIVFSSSASIYKTIINKQITENSKLEALTPYGNTKLAVENMLGDLTKDKSNNWRIIILRYFNPVGAHISGLLGENPKGTPDNLFPILLKVASGEYDYLEIYGNDWPTYDGTCVRDYIHVMDLAESHLSALAFILESPPILLKLNIGTGIGKSVLDVVNSFNDFNNCSIKYIFGSRRLGDAPYVVADNSLAISTLKWFPKRNLKDMCIDAWRWKLNNISK